MAGEDALPPLFPDDAFDVAGADAHTVARAFDAWKAEIAFADHIVEAAPNLEIVGIEPGEGPVSLRWVLAHMVEEYAHPAGRVVAVVRLRYSPIRTPTPGPSGMSKA